MVETTRHYGYILRGQITGLYKVGITGNPERRFRSYKTHIPERITQEAVKAFISAEEARDWERLILEDYADSIEHGEWLAVDFEEMATACCYGSGPTITTLKGSVIVVADSHLMFSPNFTRVFRCSDDECAAGLVAIIPKLYLGKIPRHITPEVLDGQRLNIAEDDARRQLLKDRIAKLRAEFPSSRAPEGWISKSTIDKLAWLDEHYPIRPAAAGSEQPDGW